MKTHICQKQTELWLIHQAMPYQQQTHSNNAVKSSLTDSTLCGHKYLTLSWLQTKTRIFSMLLP